MKILEVYSATNTKYVTNALGGVAQWLGRQSLAGGQPLIYV